LLSFGVSGEIRVGGNLFKDHLGAVGMSADVAAQPLCVGNQVFKFFVVLVVCEVPLFESVHLRFGVEQAVCRFLSSLTLNHTGLHQL
jgi:hypothetical protein